MFQIAAAWLSLFDVIFLILLLPLFDRLVYPRLDRAGLTPTLRGRIVIGMIFSVVAVCTAGVVETYRLAVYWRNGTENTYWQRIGQWCLPVAHVAHRTRRTLHTAHVAHRTRRTRRTPHTSHTAHAIVKAEIRSPPWNFAVCKHLRYCTLQRKSVILSRVLARVEQFFNLRVNFLL